MFFPLCDDDREVTSAAFLTYGLLAANIVVAATVYGQNAAPKAPTDAFQEMFEKFAKQAGPMAPMFEKLSSEQQEQLDRIKVSIAEEKKFGSRILDAYIEQLKLAKITVSQQGTDVVYLRRLLKMFCKLRQRISPSIQKRLM